MRVVIGRQHDPRLDRLATEQPGALAAAARVPHADRETAQVVQRFHSALAFKQARATHQNVAIGEEAARHHRLMGNRADPKGHVDPILDEIDAPLGGEHLHADIRIAPLEHPQQLPPGFEAGRQRQPQASLQTRLVRRQGLLRLVQYLDTARGVLVETHARLGQPRAADRTLEQLHGELVLQLADPSAERRQRYLKACGCSRQAARLNDADEHTERIEVHASLS